MQFKYWDLIGYGLGHGKWCCHAPLEVLAEIGDDLLALHKSQRIGAFKYQIRENDSMGPYKDVHPVCVVYAKEADHDSFFDVIVGETIISNPYWVSARDFMSKKVGEVTVEDCLKKVPQKFFKNA